MDPTIVWGNCSSYSIHAGTAVSFDGVPTTVFTGNVGVSPGTSITGIYSKTGTEEINTASAISCAISKQMTYIFLKSLICPNSNVLDSPDLSGKTLLPGIWCSSFPYFDISSTLTLDGGGDSNSVWVFQTASTLNTATATSIILKNGAQSKNVFWVIGSSATLGSSSFFVGQINAAVSITVGTNAQIDGRIFAGAAVTFAGGASINLPIYNTTPIDYGTASGTIVHFYFFLLLLFVHCY